MKKLVVTVGLIAGCAAGSFAPASAVPMYDPWTACKASGLSDQACSEQVNANDPAVTPGAGFGWTGSAAAR